MKAACAALSALRCQQDAERAEHRRYCAKARNEVMRLRRRVTDTGEQLQTETEKVGYSLFASHDESANFLETA